MAFAIDCTGKKMKNESLRGLPFNTESQSGLIALQYTGFFSPQNITAMGEVVKLFLENHEQSQKVRRRLFSSFVEIAQNILRYSQDSRALSHNDQLYRFGSLSLRYDDGRYYLESANLVGSDATHQLRGDLDSLRVMNADEIKQAYRNRLRAESPVWSKGANIGLLTLARDVSEPLEYCFQPLEASELSAFWLKATICHD
ncbi:Putative uncharacterized protein {ECO:0000313/EMBL:BAK12621.1} [Pantoea ananatis]|nr:Putative uncharacterized protein {ECO:0000313/EMBL:BAK12621.1} [Pantoea ananatis]